MHPEMEPPIDPYEPLPDVDLVSSATKALLGGLLSQPHRAAEVQTMLDRDDFRNPDHMHVWDTIHATAATGTLPEHLVVLQRLQNAGNTSAVRLMATLLDTGTHGQFEEYAKTIRDDGRTRKMATGLRTALHAIEAGGDPESAFAQVDRVFEQQAVRFASSTHRQIRRHVRTVDELLAAGDGDDVYDWAIPNLLERQERVILTAEEGAGKSTLLRQVAVQAAAGIHPFTLRPMKPITVLHVDVENSERQSRRQYRPLRLQAGAQIDPTRLRIEIRPEGIDLTTTEDRQWLTDTCASVKPDLLVIGPIYKLANGDPNDEKSSKPVAMALDAIRVANDCAVILEAHAAKAAGGQKKRPHEPYGWSGWLRWPEHGLWLDKDGSLTPWRGAREERDWPTSLLRGGAWPWSRSLSEREELWDTLQRVRTEHGEPLSYRDAAEKCGVTKRRIEDLVGPGGPFQQKWKALAAHDVQSRIDVAS